MPALADFRVGRQRADFRVVHRLFGLFARFDVVLRVFQILFQKGDPFAA
jgi:hypothetical protein